MRSNKKTVVTPTEVAAEALQEATGVEVKSYQFTKEANWRVRHSFYESELRDYYAGKNDVSLFQVESTILNFEIRDGKRQNLEADIDLSRGELAKCELELDRNCAREFLPKLWVAKSEKYAGNYTPDLADTEIAVCHSCQQLICEDIRAYNAKVSEQERKMFPRFLPKADAEDAVVRRQKAIDAQRAREGKLGTIRDKLQIVADLKRRYGR